jgi:CxxC-x17-CxxC domain-containing protein
MMAAKKTKTSKNVVKNKEKKVKMEVEDLLGELQLRFDLLSEKLDALLSKSTAILRAVGTESDPSFKTEATVTKKFPIPQDNPPRERKMHKAVCAECNAVCEVPFVPRPDRPVYCKACYTSRRNVNSRSNMPNREQIVAEIAKTFKIDVDKPVKAKPAKSKKVKPKASAAKKSSAKRSKSKK